MKAHVMKMFLTYCYILKIILIFEKSLIVFVNYFQQILVVNQYNL